MSNKKSPGGLLGRLFKKREDVLEKFHQLFDEEIERRVKDGSYDANEHTLLELLFIIESDLRSLTTAVYGLLGFIIGIFLTSLVF